MVDTKTNISFSHIGGDGAFSKPSRWQKSYPLSTAREWDEESQTYCYRARQYNPSIGRFLQPEPQPSGYGVLNLYTYVRNNPIMYVFSESGTFKGLN